MTYRVLSKYRSELMGLAMLWVMCFHAYDLDLGLPLLNFGRAAGFGGVDIFILLSSMGLAMSLTRREQDYASFMKRRASRILPAYFAVMLPYTLFLILYRDAPWASLVWNSTILYYWVRPAGAFNWYIAGAMTFYALTPACLDRLRRAKHREALALGVAAAGDLVCQLFMHEGFWRYLDIFYRVPVFFLGLLIGLYVLEERKLTAKSAVVWSASFLLGVAYVCLMRAEVDVSPVILQLCYVFLLTTVPMCLAACVLFEKLPLGALRRFLRLVGENSLEIYLLNVSVFSEIELLRRLVSFGPSNRLYFLIMFAVNIALGCLLHRAIAALKKEKSIVQQKENARI